VWGRSPKPRRGIGGALLFITFEERSIKALFSAFNKLPTRHRQRVAKVCAYRHVSSGVCVVDRGTRLSLRFVFM
jgi:hypothetical protein